MIKSKRPAYGWAIRIFAAIIVAAALCPLVVSAGEGEQTLERSVVMIRGVRQDFDHTTPWKQVPMSQGVGSGFVIEGNRILTNAHNVSNNKYIEIKKQHQAKRHLGRLEFIGHDCDLAIVTVDDGDFYADMQPLELGGLPKVNSTVQTYGFPMGGRDVSVTEGVVSRVQVSVYSHTLADSHLVIQTDAAINPGNSGGPVLQDGKVVGVAFQGMQDADNIGYMIPTTVARHFLADIEDGKYDGFGSLGFTFFTGLHNAAYTDYLEVPPGTEGVVVLNVLMHSSVESLFKHGDVITRIDDFDIDNDGMIGIHGLTLHLSEAIELKQLGEKAELTFYRKGRKKTASATVALNRTVVPFWREYDSQPRYKVFAGLVFVPVSRNFMETWGRSWATDIPFYLRYLFHNSMQLNTDRQRKEYVVLSEILPDEVNSYSSGFINKVVDTVNGVDIRSLDDLSDAFAVKTGDHCVMEFMSSSMPLILDQDKALRQDGIIVEKYKVPSPADMETAQ